MIFDKHALINAIFLMQGYGWCVLPVGIVLKKQESITQNSDYSTGIGDAQFALVVLLTTSCLLIAITLIVILWLI